MEFRYNQDGQLTRAGDANLAYNAAGILDNFNIGSFRTTLSRSSFGELTNLESKYSNTVLYDATYTRDALGRLITMTEVVEGVSTIYEYTYNSAGRLVEVRENGSVSATYTYDLNGNRLSKSDDSGDAEAVFDAQDRMLSQGDVTLTYSDDGERLTKSVEGMVTETVYDAAGNLTEVELPNGSTINYLVDSANRRVARSVDGVRSHAWLYHDLLNPIAELDAEGAVVSRFVYAGGQVPIYMVKGGVTYGFVTDHLGSVRLVVDRSTGEIAQRLDYDAYGQVLFDSNPGFQPFGYAGGLYDPLTGLVRFGFRDYDPEVGRWTTKDPIGFAGGDSNLYAYVGGDPINQIDPSGLKGWYAYGGAIFWSGVKWLGVQAIKYLAGATVGTIAGVVNFAYTLYKLISALKERSRSRDLSSAGLLSYGKDAILIALCDKCEARRDAALKVLLRELKEFREDSLMSFEDYVEVLTYLRDAVRRNGRPVYEPDDIAGGHHSWAPGVASLIGEPQWGGWLEEIDQELCRDLGKLRAAGELPIGYGAF